MPADAQDQRGGGDRGRAGYDGQNHIVAITVSVKCSDPLILRPLMVDHLPEAVDPFRMSNVVPTAGTKPLIRLMPVMFNGSNCVPTAVPPIERLSTQVEPWVYVFLASRIAVLAAESAGVIVACPPGNHG